MQRSSRSTRGLTAIVIAALGAALAIAGMEWLTFLASLPVWSVPFATSIVLVMGSPESPPAQPRCLIGGHVLSTLVGLCAAFLFGPSPWAAAAAVGVAVLAMQLTGTFHPPAGIDPLIVVVNGVPWTFLVSPVLLGALLLLAFTYIWMNVVRGYRWPQAWW